MVKLNMVGSRPNALKTLKSDRADYMHSNVAIPVFVKCPDNFL